MRIDIDDRWRVNASCELDAPIRATQMWGHMRDWIRFATLDPLHSRIRILSLPTGLDGGSCCRYRGIRFVIEHRLLGIGPDRIGRMLVWREGDGFVFSDLSKRGMKVGFPHVCSYRVQQLTESSCRLHVGARGRWTARWLPRWIVRLWLGWVLFETRAHIQRELKQFHAWLHRPQAAD